jgi:hypothetical protein
MAVSLDRPTLTVMTSTNPCLWHSSPRRQIFGAGRQGRYGDLEAGVTSVAVMNRRLYLRDSPQSVRRHGCGKRSRYLASRALILDRAYHLKASECVCV